MQLSHILRKENNNLDIFRVAAALMVIYGHAYALLPTEGKRDILGSVLSFDYSGSLAVKIFFFLSGLVVTNSLIEKRDIRQFAISRFFRIWPAFAVTLAASAFILGPFLTKHSSQGYFSDPAVYNYFLRSLILKIQWELPGVFANNAVDAVNGSLWSIVFEVYAYILLAIVFFLGITRWRPISLALFVIILIVCATGSKYHFRWLPLTAEIRLLVPCFAAGSLFAVYKDKIQVNLAGFVAVWLPFSLLSASKYNYYLLYIAIFYSILYISSRPQLVRFKPATDISYGLYLWGWPVQQVMAQYFPGYGVGFNQISSAIIAAVLGYASWHLIERPSIKMGTNFGKMVSSRTFKVFSSIKQRPSHDCIPPL